jgi:hypothetical protein
VTHTKDKMRNARLALVWAVAGGLCLLTVDNAAFAQPKKARYLPDKVKAAKKRVEGWTFGLTLGGSVSVAHANSVVGQIDGTTIALGAQLTGSASYLRGGHEWRNSLKLSETVTRTPAIDEFVKSNDLLTLDSIYLYHFKRLSWLGPFVRFQLETAIFPNSDVRGEDVTYSVDGVTRGPQHKIHITDAFSPLTLKQSAGLFAKPAWRDDIDVEIKLGFAARQTFADGQLVVDDDDTTDPIEVKSLKDFVQGGPVAGITIKGKLKKGLITYYLDAETMLPVLNDLDDADDRNSLDLLNVAFHAGISFKLFSWMSMDYQFRAIREPQLLDAWQVQNNLLLTFTYALVGGK